MTPPPVIVLATSNLHKVQEMRVLLGGAGVTLLGLGDIPGLAGHTVAETGHTFAENARQKALGYGAFHDHYTLAEDSGLCVDALGGAPGVLSARFGEEQGGPSLMSCFKSPSWTFKTPGWRGQSPLAGAKTSGFPTLRFSETVIHDRKRPLENESPFVFKQTLTDEGRNALLLERMAGQPNRRAHYHCAMCLVKDGRVVAEVCGEVFGEIAAACRGEAGFGYDPLFIPEGYQKTFGELPAAVKGALSHRAVAARSLVKQLQGLAA